MRPQCNSKPLEFEGHGPRRLVAKKLILLLAFLRAPSWIFFVVRVPSWIESRRFLPSVRNVGTG